MVKISMIALLTLLTACGGQFSLPSEGAYASAQTSNSTQSGPKILTVRSDFSNQVWAELQFSIVGGGEIELSIRPHSGTAELLIHLTRYNFQARDFTLSVTPANDPSLYAGLADILDNTSTMQSVPAQGLAGSYKQVSLHHPSISVIPLYTSPLINGSSAVFDELYSHVISRI